MVSVTVILNVMLLPRRFSTITLLPPSTRILRSLPSPTENPGSLKLTSDVNKLSPVLMYWSAVKPPSLVALLAVPQNVKSSVETPVCDLAYVTPFLTTVKSSMAFLLLSRVKAVLLTIAMVLPSDITFNIVCGPSAVLMVP